MSRFYSFSIVSYASLSEIQNLLQACRHYVYILHDKDVNEDGSLRSPHFHILCTFVQNKSFNSVASLVVSRQLSIAAFTFSSSNERVELSLTRNRKDS